MQIFSGDILVRSSILLVAATALLAACSDERPVITKVPSTESLTGTVLYRERMMLRPGAKLTVTLQDVSRMDVPATIISTATYDIENGPPFPFELNYDPSGIDKRNRYALRARIDIDGRLAFTSTEAIDAFGGEPGEPVTIVVSQAASHVPDASLVDTYWKVVTMEREPVPLGAGNRELHLVLGSEQDTIHGFSGCNRYVGSFALNDDGLTIAPRAATSMACVDGMELEGQFLSNLGNVRGYRIRGENLALLDSGGSPILTFEAVYLQ